MPEDPSVIAPKDLMMHYVQTFGGETGQSVLADLRDLMRGDAPLEPLVRTHDELVVLSAMRDLWDYIETMSKGK